MKKNYEQIIDLKAEKIKIDMKIKNLKPKAVKELREMGYSFDKIVNILGIAKINAIKYSK